MLQIASVVHNVIFQSLVSVAPMVDCTDRHYRRFIRLIAPRALLYTEMLVDNAIRFGNTEKLLNFSEAEKPVVLQLAGSDPTALADAARTGEQFGYSGLNLNVGCPSPRVKAGGFGACLMEQPKLVAGIVDRMQKSVSIPVTVKCRIGTENRDSYNDLRQFVLRLVDVGLKGIVIHARIAVLEGFSTAQNLNVPPLQYDVVKQIKHEFPELHVVVNGGLDSPEKAVEHLSWADGIMIGRTAYQKPDVFAKIYRSIHSQAETYCPFEIFRSYLPYVLEELGKGTPLRNLSRHLVHLFSGTPGVKNFRRYLSTNQNRHNADENVLLDALAFLNQPGNAHA